MRIATTSSVPTVFTIGFTKSSARFFFDRLQRAGVKKLVDVRLNNTSQLSGFAKRDDLAYFLEAIGGITYEHDLALAPTAALLEAYRASADWEVYAREFVALLRDRRVETRPFETMCFACSEHRAEHCHRRLVAEYLAREWGAAVVHL